MEWPSFSVMECSQPKGVKPKMTGRKLRSGVFWQGASKHKGLKQVGGVKQGLRVFVDSPVWKLWRSTILACTILSWLFRFLENL